MSALRYAYTFTVYWTADEEFSIKEHENIKRWVWGNETCPTTKRKHIQGYLELKRERKFDWIKGILQSANAHIEAAKGTPQQNYTYCTKEGDYKTYGNWEQQPGKRNDLIAIKAKLDKGEDVIDTHFESWVRHYKAFERYAMLKHSKTQRDVKVNVVWGKPGTGKTRMAWEYDPDLYPLTLENGKAWFDGYQGEKTLLIDDIGLNKIDYEYLLRLLDRYPVRLPTKGGSTWAGWETVFITSNDPPERWFSREISALTRRLTTISRVGPREGRGGEEVILDSSPTPPRSDLILPENPSSKCAEDALQASIHRAPS